MSKIILEIKEKMYLFCICCCLLQNTNRVRTNRTRECFKIFGKCKNFPHTIRCVSIGLVCLVKCLKTVPKNRSRAVSARVVFFIKFWK